MRSFGGGTVTTSLFGPAVVVPSRLILDGPGSLALEFVPDGDAIRLNAVTVNGAALSPPPG